MPSIIPFSDEQSRLIVNLHMRYEAWMDVERELAALPYDLRRKRVNGRDYLYRIYDRGGNGTSLGPMAAYSIEANSRINVPDETEGFDLAWIAETPDSPATQVWDMLKAVDPTFAINSERDFQARNAKAYEVELQVAPSRVNTLGPKDQPRPLPLPEQGWLLLGRPVDQVIGCRDGSPARIIAPDPRWFALHKLWLAD